MNAADAAKFDEERGKMAASLSDIETRFGETEGKLQNMHSALGTEAPGKLTDEIVAYSTGLSGLLGSSNSKSRNAGPDGRFAPLQAGQSQRHV